MCTCIRVYVYRGAERERKVSSLAGDWLAPRRWTIYLRFTKLRGEKWRSFVTGRRMFANRGNFVAAGLTTVTSRRRNGVQEATLPANKVILLRFDRFRVSIWRRRPRNAGVPQTRFEIPAYPICLGILCGPVVHEEIALHPRTEICAPWFGFNNPAAFRFFRG